MFKNNSPKRENVKFSIFTFGCKTNQSESDYIARDLARSGFKWAGKDEIPDFVIVNTCTVTSASDRKARHLIRKLKKENPSSMIIVAGCFVEFNKSFFREENIDYFFENKNKDKITGFIKDYFLNEPYDGDFNIKKDSLSSGELFTIKHTRQLIKIQDGCEQYCAYCIVPVVRHGYSSQDPDIIINMINEVCQAGIFEVVLTGIHIGKYGIDFNLGKESHREVSDLYQLITAILEKTGIKRIRLSSIEINEISDDLIRLISSEKRIAPHLHIPLQSGSSRILSQMKRPYNMDYFYERIAIIIKNINQNNFAALTTDIIAGFPGEDENDFNMTMQALNYIKFSKAHIFKYSPRKNTEAFSMGNQISEEIKNERSLKLREAAYTLRTEFLGKNLKKTLEVLVEKDCEDNDEGSGMSENYIKVYFDSNKYPGKNIKGKIINIKAVSLFKDGIKGIIV